MDTEYAFSSFFVLSLVVVVVNFLYWITDGEMYHPKSQVVTTAPGSPNNIFSRAKFYLSKTANWLQGFFWRILDSWRKPDYELFVRYPKQECIEKLELAVDDEAKPYNLDMLLTGYFNGDYFYLQKWSHFPFVKNGGSGFRPVLFGKFSSTPQGTYIRFWHRFKTFWIFFYTVGFGIALSLLSSELILTARYSSQSLMDWNSMQTKLVFILVPIFSISTFFLSIFIGSLFGKNGNPDIIVFVKDALKYHRTSTDISLLQKIARQNLNE